MMVYDSAIKKNVKRCKAGLTIDGKEGEIVETISNFG